MKPGVVATAILIAIAIGGAVTAERRKLYHVPNLVRATRDIHGLSTLVADDVTPVEGASEMIGAIAKTSLDRGQVILPSALVATKESVNGRWLIRVPTEVEALSSPGGVAVLLGVDARHRRAAVVSRHAIVVAHDPTSCILALTEEDAVAAAPYVSANRKLLVLKPVSDR